MRIVNYNRAFLWLACAALVLRAIHVFGLVDFQLSGDETYYFDWGRRPDWCYFSKPPLIGWIMGIVRVVFGFKWWALRMTSLLLGTVTLICIFATCRAMYDARSGFFAALMFLLTPANAALNFGLTIDALLLLCWSAGLLLFWRAMKNPSSAFGWFILSLDIGIGVLAKQMMLVFPLLMLISISCVPEHRTLLKRPALWLCLSGVPVFVAPLLWWNAQHGYTTILHTGHHFDSSSQTFVDKLTDFLSYQLYQALMYGPLTFVLLIVAMVISARNWVGLPARERMLLVFSALPLSVVLVRATSQHINENWPAAFYPAAFVLAAGVLLRLEVWRRWPSRAAAVGALLMVLVYAAIPMISLVGLRGSKYDPFSPMRGWELAAQPIGELLEAVPRPEKTFVLVLDHRHNASQMAFHLPQHPTVYRWTRTRAVESQYEVWPGAESKVGWDAFIISPNSPANNYEPRPLLRRIQRSFNRIEKLADIDIEIGNGTHRAFQVYLSHEMQHWPEQDSVIPEDDMGPGSNGTDLR
jgi:4-amino-4-deoxy-L-arabinose transferase-like glycosyltransferase